MASQLGIFSPMTLNFPAYNAYTQAVNAQASSATHGTVFAYAQCVCKWSAVFLKGRNKFEEAISGLIGSNVVTLTTEHMSSGISFPATHNINPLTQDIMAS